MKKTAIGLIVLLGASATGYYTFRDSDTTNQTSPDDLHSVDSSADIQPMNEFDNDTREDVGRPNTTSSTSESRLVGTPPEGTPPTTDGEAAGPRPTGRTQPDIDLAAAATTLGVSEAVLEAALGEPGQGTSDFAAVALELGVTEAELTAALGIPAGGGPANGERPAGRP